MSLQWTAVAAFLYGEVFAVLLLCVPFISPTRWNRVFKSRLVKMVMAYGNAYFVVLIVILVFLLMDACREVRKYSVTEKMDLTNNPVAVEHIHMKLFRAQRNLYIAGFALLLWFLLRRLVTLLSQQASMVASNEAFRKQAEGAGDAARNLLRRLVTLLSQQASMVASNEAFRKQAEGAGDAARKYMEENERLQEATLQTSENDVKAIKKQAENLTKEYDRLLEEHAKLQVSVGVKFCVFSHMNALI
ncbi:UNVERIFIED_CONTAM: hypothetical protein FKN15_065688 [Acipenser sinensis]